MSCASRLQRRKSAVTTEVSSDSKEVAIRGRGGWKSAMMDGGDSCVKTDGTTMTLK